jgi:hypothetical protein
VTICYPCIRRPRIRPAPDRPFQCRAGGGGTPRGLDRARSPTGGQGDSEEADAASEVEQQAARAQADDQNGDDQPGEQGDEQGENEDCGD